MPKPIVVLNWKNHPNSLFEAKSLLKKLVRDSRSHKKVSLFIAPPYTYLAEVASSRRSIGIASQDMPQEAQGSHTGEVSPEILKSFGVKLAIIGHSERRAQGESDGVVSKKAKNAIRSGITPLVCVGEEKREEDGEHFEFLRKQLKLSLATLQKSDANKLMIAYEPIWAIGKSAKESIKAEELSEVIIFIRKVLVEVFGRTLAEKIPILYGGSVEPANAASLWQTKSVRGFLVGHASLNARDLKSIVESLFEK